MIPVHTGCAVLRMKMGRSNAAWRVAGAVMMDSCGSVSPSDLVVCMAISLLKTRILAVLRCRKGVESTVGDSTDSDSGGDDVGKLQADPGAPKRTQV